MYAGDAVISKKKESILIDFRLKDGIVEVANGMGITKLENERKLSSV